MTAHRQDHQLQRAVCSVLRAIRKEAGFTQKQLSERTGTHRANIARAEQAWQLPSIVWVNDMCRACRVNPPLFWTRVYSAYWAAQSSSETTSSAG